MIWFVYCENCPLSLRTEVGLVSVHDAPLVGDVWINDWLFRTQEHDFQVSLEMNPGLDGAIYRVNKWEINLESLRVLKFWKLYIIWTTDLILLPIQFQEIDVLWVLLVVSGNK
jgi:hypothetical protein